MSLVCIFLFTSYLHNNNYSGHLSETQLAEKFSTASSTSLLSSSPSPPPPLTTAEEIETEIKADTSVVEELQGLESAFSRTLVKVNYLSVSLSSTNVTFLRLSCSLMFLLILQISADVTILTNS